MSSFYNDYLNKQKKTNTPVLRMPNVAATVLNGSTKSNTANKPMKQTTTASPKTTGSALKNTTVNLPTEPVSAPITAVPSSIQQQGSVMKPVSNQSFGIGVNNNGGLFNSAASSVQQHVDVSKPIGPITAENVGTVSLTTNKAKTPSDIRNNIERKARKKSENPLTRILML